jgi:hypothetical protein
MTKFRYSGPTSGILLADGRELVLIRGKVFDLDPSDPALKLHLHFNRLTIIAEPPAKKPKKFTHAEPAIVAEPDAPESTPTEGGQS